MFILHRESYKPCENLNINGKLMIFTSTVRVNSHESTNTTATLRDRVQI